MSAVSLIVDIVITIIVLIIVLPILASAIRVVPEYQRLVKLRLGKFKGVYGPGIVFVVPFIDRVITVDLRTIMIDMPSQRALTRDNVEVSIDASVYLRVLDAKNTVLSVQEYRTAAATIAAATLRDVVGMVDLDTLLTQREEVAKKIAAIVDEHVEPWGLKITSVAIKDVKLPDTLVRAMAAQAEAERMRRAKVILAQADYEASQMYLKAAETYTKNPTALTLRQLDTLLEVAKEHNLILVVPSSLEPITAAALALRGRLQEGQGSSQGG
ncbi:MAG: membrane protease subunit, stomatin/prohibitin-like protein [Caldivirga sp. CIS_19]|jgi:SPFH domain, Band 7 family protein|nr:MAG: membrane protease subunit, stomatin/prohibitin-like protein [Caldivirga sp. CIS_19]